MIYLYFIISFFLNKNNNININIKIQYILFYENKI